MGFNAQKYTGADFHPRTDVVHVFQLKDFFDDGEVPEWKVRGLTANELAIAKDAQDKIRNASALTEVLLTGTKSEKVRELQQSLGYSDDVHSDIARRMEMLTMGSVTPECSLELAVILAKNHPETFYSLTNQILILTGQGAEQASKKPKPSGKTVKSVPA